MMRLLLRHVVMDDIVMSNVVMMRRTGHGGCGGCDIVFIHVIIVVVHVIMRSILIGTNGNIAIFIAFFSILLLAKGWCRPRKANAIQAFDALIGQLRLVTLLLQGKLTALFHNPPAFYGRLQSLDKGERGFSKKERESSHAHCKRNVPS
jgi:hypothetical protein